MSMATEDIYATKTRSLIAGDITLICLSSIFVALRFLARRIARAGLWYDDYAIAAALPLAWLPAIMNLVATHYGFGKHVQVAPPDAVEKWYLCLYIFENFYAPAIATVKASILLFYARIFPSQNVWFRRSLYAMAVIVFLWWIICQFVVIFECTPIHFFWERKPVTGHCINIQSFFLGQAIPNIITDGILLALPLPMIWDLHLPRAQKMALSGVFLLGSFVTATSIYRLTLLLKLTQVDITWNYADAAVWSAVEPNVAIVSACLPMLRPLLKLARPTFSSARSKGKEYSSSSGLSGGRHGTPQRAWLSSQEPIVPKPALMHGRQFTRLPESSASERGGRQEEWEMQRPREEAKRTNFVGRGDKKGGGGGGGEQTELGQVPVDAIHVQREVEQVDHRIA